jgi:hypothetical protein
MQHVGVQRTLVGAQTAVATGMCGGPEGAAGAAPAACRRTEGQQPARLRTACAAARRPRARGMPQSWRRRAAPVRSAPRRLHAGRRGQASSRTQGISAAHNSRVQCHAATCARHCAKSSPQCWSTGSDAECISGLGHNTQQLLNAPKSATSAHSQNTPDTSTRVRMAPRALASKP